MEAILNSFALVFFSEMGDKTQLMALVLAARFRRPWAVLAGIAVGSMANHSLAALAGELFGTLVSSETVRWALAATFFICGLWSMIPEKEDGEHLPPSKYGAFATTCILFFLAEMGDKTQLATVALGARYGAWLMVASASTVAMVAADGLVVFLGHKLHARLPMKALRIGSGLLFMIFGVYILVSNGGS